jgi:hypothetical protein
VFTTVISYYVTKIDIVIEIRGNLIGVNRDAMQVVNAGSSKRGTTGVDTLARQFVTNIFSFSATERVTSEYYFAGLSPACGSAPWSHRSCLRVP